MTDTKPQKLKPDWKVIKSLYLEGFLPQAISEKTGIGSNTIRVGLAKRGVTKVRREQSHALAPVGDAESYSRVTRAKLAAAADKLADCLQNPPKSLEKQVLYADVLQKNAKTASLVHGWSENAAIALVVAGVITDKPEQEAIEVQTEVDPEV